MLKLLLYPFAVLYDLITRVRNYLFDIGHKVSFEFETGVISVGNLNAGGSGKTPMIEYLVRLLKDRYKVVTLSRGYKRDTNGFKIADLNDSAKTLGDEPFQLFRKFSPQVRVVVGEDRAFAISNILHQLENAQVILLDDAFQHRTVRPQLSVLVTDYAKPFYQDHVIPFGRLREARKGACRANIIVVTKCPHDLDKNLQNGMKKRINEYAANAEVFFSAIRYAEAVKINETTDVQKNVIIVTGIATSQPFVQYCNSKYNVIRHFEYADHHRFTAEDIASIKSEFAKAGHSVSLLSTEKDMVKLISPDIHLLIVDLPWFYIPIEHYFLEDGLKFDERIIQAVRNTLPNE